MKLAKRLALAIGLATVASQAWGFFEVDGKFGGTDEGYTLGFDVSFQVEGAGLIDGGRLFFGTDAGDGDHYAYFAMPKDFVDNTYGANSVGWKAPKGHSLKDLVNSDALGKSKNDLNAFVLKTTGGDLALQVDYIATDDDKNPGFYRSGGIGGMENGGTQNNTALKHNEGRVISGDASGVKEISTSLEYNLNDPSNLNNPDSTLAADIAASTDKAPVGLLEDSPEVSGVDANGDYVCASATDSVCANWVFEVGYEFRFDASMFGDGWADPTQAQQIVDGQTVLSFVDLGESHVSPNKGGKFQDVVVSCDDSFGDGCDGSPPPPPTTTAPEPGTGLLFGLGLLVLAFGMRRRRVAP